MDEVDSQRTSSACPDAPIERLAVSAYTVPTDAPESDGTFEWDSTTLVLAEARAAGETGIGYSYTGTAAARLIEDVLARAVAGRDAVAPRSPVLRARRRRPRRVLLRPCPDRAHALRRRARAARRLARSGPLAPGSRPRLQARGCGAVPGGVLRENRG